MRSALKDLALAVLLVALCALAALLPPLAHAQASAAPGAGVPQSAPQAALQYRRLLVRTAHAAWGLDAPVAVFAAQVHQESAWRPLAVSHVGAQGLAQFMPATTRWIGSIDPALASRQPYSPAWALRALVTYDLWLFERTPPQYGAFDRMWVALRAYNGGLGHWQAEARGLGVRLPTRLQVDAACGSARRAAVHCRENLGYPQRILVLIQPRYAAWGPGV
jgi:soluble lytic murein transglycosylase-like protein